MLPTIELTDLHANRMTKYLLATSQTSSSSPSQCDRWQRKLDQCITKRGTHSEKCCIPKLNLKRCTAFDVCPREAAEYYNTNLSLARKRTAVTVAKQYTGETSPSSEQTNKGLCASFQESFCFGNPRIMNVDGGHSDKKSVKQKTAEEIFLHHERAKRRVTNRRDKHRECIETTKRLDRCLRMAGLDFS